MVHALLIISVLGVTLATVLPITGSSMRGERSRECRARLQAVREATVAYFEDSLQFPASLDDLLEPPDGLGSWCGPYLAVAVSDQRGRAMHSPLRDAWGEPIELVVVNAWERVLVSHGPNGIDEDGAGDDLSAPLAVHHILWEVTMRELSQVNKAIAKYNVHEPPPWLPPQWEATVNVLQAQNYLPMGPAPKFEFRRDGWGRMYEPTGHPVSGGMSLGPPGDS